MKKYKFLFIDLDDTLWDFHANAKSALHDVFMLQKLYERFDDFENFYEIYSKRNIELWTQYGQGLITKEYLTMERFLHPLRKVGVDDGELAVNMNAAFLQILGTKTQLIPNAKELLEFVTQKQIPITLISNGFKEVQHKKMSNSGIEHYFTHVVLSETAGALKPSPDIFNYALNLNNAAKEDVLMVGDSFEADIFGAISSEIDAVYFAPTHVSPKSEEFQNQFLRIKSLNELLVYFQ